MMLNSWERRATFVMYCTVAVVASVVFVSAEVIEGDWSWWIPVWSLIVAPASLVALVFLTWQVCELIEPWLEGEGRD